MTLDLAKARALLLANLVARLGLVGVAILLAGCSAIPRDSAGTLDRVRGGELRVGVARHAPWVELDGDAVRGIEPGLIQAWAAQLGARVRWQDGAEAELVEALHRRELDVLVAGFEHGTPYKKKIALTQPYLESVDRRGQTRRHVIAVMPGESALLFSLDRFLAAQDRAALARQAAEARP